MSFIGPLLADGYAGKLTTLRQLQLACGMDDQEAARFCLVSPETYRRWRTDRPPNPTAVRLLAIRAGYLPWPEWRGWEVHGGCLFPPGIGRGGFSPGALLAAPLWFQVAQAREAELAALRGQFLERSRRRA